ncbi:MAG: MFS transporter [Oleiphilaceae bacterium]|nr:MFS transporter [Oleiphilaceae bacterium]
MTLDESMTPSERKSVLSLAMLYAMRMLGLFMVLPVFVLYGQDLEAATPELLGLAIGAYGLSQALLQIPYGSLSDRFGRKPLIVLGLAVFAFGSVVAAMSESIYGVIIGRLLQGAGAIASVLMALLSDLTSEESRTKAMAIVGMSIGVSFAVALILGPLIAGSFGLSGIFWFTALMAVLGLIWVLRKVPEPATLQRSRDTRLFKDQLGAVLRDTELLRLDAGIFCLHLVLTAMFVAVPISLVRDAGVAEASHWWFYLSVMVLSFVAMVPFIIVAEKKQRMKQIFLGAIALLAGGAFSLTTQTEALSIWIALFAFFMAFNFLEASLPSLVSKVVPAGTRGTAMGVYSTSQFLGAFAGGIAGGWAMAEFGIDGVYVLVCAVVLVWWLLAIGMRKPSSKGLSLSLKQVVTQEQAETLRQRLLVVDGVLEVVVVPEDGVLHLKVSLTGYDENTLNEALSGFR